MSGLRSERPVQPMLLITLEFFPTQKMNRTGLVRSFFRVFFFSVAVVEFDHKTTDSFGTNAGGKS